MIMTVSYDGAQYYVSRNVGTYGALMVVPFTTFGAATIYMHGFFKEAENSRKSSSELDAILDIDESERAAEKPSTDLNLDVKVHYHNSDGRYYCNFDDSDEEDGPF